MDNLPASWSSASSWSVGPFQTYSGKDCLGDDKAKPSVVLSCLVMSAASGVDVLGLAFCKHKDRDNETPKSLYALIYTL